MKRFIVFILSATLGIAAFAQELYPSQMQDEKTYPVGKFASLSVSDNFEVTVQDGSCNVKVTADKALLPYVQVYVREGVLYIQMDTQSIPSDVKKIYKGRNAPTPITRAVVTMPAVYKLLVHKNAVVSSNGPVYADSLHLSLDDKAAVRNLKLQAPYTHVSLSKNAQADFQFNGDVLEASLAGNSRCKVSGEAGTFSFHSERLSKLDGLQMKAARVKADMKGDSQANVLADGILSVRLTGGSALYYAGFPTIQVDEILRSTFAPYEK